MTAPAVDTLTRTFSGPAILRLEVRSDRIAVVTIDDAKAAVNEVTEALLTQLDGVAERLRSDPGIVGAIFVSGKTNGFVVGEDIHGVRGLRFASDGERYARRFAGHMSRLSSIDKPLVAAIHGPALGAGFELALACDAIVASDDAATRVGFPEVRWGLLPVGNGLLRAARRAGLRAALSIGTSGEEVSRTRASRLGLVDEVCPRAEMIEAAAKRATALGARGSASNGAFWGGREPRARRALERFALSRRVLFARARAQTRADPSHGSPAAPRVLEVLARFARSGFVAAAETEARAFGELVVTDRSRRLVEVASAIHALAADRGSDDPSATAFSVERVAVLGIGLTTAGIAFLTARAGVAVDEAPRYAELSRADLVIDAGDPELSEPRARLRELEASMRPAAVFASTAHVAVAALAEASQRPSRVVGMRYGAPVHEAPLLEVVRTEATDPDVIATVVAFGKRQGKTVVVVRDGALSYVDRLSASCLDETARLASEGVQPAAIDAALHAWGWALGPLRARGPTGGEEPRRRRDRHAEAPTLHLPAEEIQMRAGLRAVNEAILCLREGVVRSAADADIGAILGLGFPAFRGGPLRYVDAVGPAEILRRMRDYEDRFGARWTPARALLEHASTGQRFHSD